MVAGRIDYYCGNPTTAISLIESNAINAIAVLSYTRLSALSSVATAHEQGLQGVEAANWMGFFLPRGTPAAIIRKLYDATVATIDAPSLQVRLKEIGLNVIAPECRSPEYLQTLVMSEIEKCAGPIKATGVSMD